MMQALARFLHGQDFTGLGQSRFLQMVVRQADWVPRRLRERAFAVLGAQEAVRPQAIESVSTNTVAEWATALFPDRRYPAVAIGSANGALLHLHAALGIPWLPQTFLALVDQRHVHPDDPAAAMEAETHTAGRFLAANPDAQLHHLHDPSQDRLMLGLIAYYRFKYRRLPAAYAAFIENSLAPGGTIYLIECKRRWPTTRLGDRYVFQFGAVGGPTVEEYFGGGERVEAYLRRYASPMRHWHPPAPDTDSPEAEWGFEPMLRADVEDFARRRGYRVVRIVFEDPEDPSALIADLYRDWYRSRGLPADRLVIESFVLLEPYWALRTGSAPYWMSFNMQPSLDRVRRYLDSGDPYEEIFLMLFAHGVNSVGLPPVDAWRDLLVRARVRGDFLGLDPDTYPAHFAAFARYSQDLRRKTKLRFPMPEPLAPERAERFLAERGPARGVHLEPG